MQQVQTYIITGGNTGLGYQCARFLAGNPKNLLVVACRDREKAADAAGQLRQAGCAVKFLPLDLAKLELVPEMSFPRAAHVARFCIAMTTRCERKFLLLWSVPAAKSAK